jgi:DNA-binding NarL/FixJ family response regulator
MAIRVLLVEDNDVYRSTLELVLEGREGIEIVGSVADGSEATLAAARLDPDVVLIDFRLPGLDGAQATAALRASAPGAAVLCLTAEATEDERAAILSAGAVDVVGKGRPTEELVRAIHSANPRGEPTP